MLAVRKLHKAFGRGTLDVPQARAIARCSPTCASTTTSASSASPTSSRAAQPVELDLAALQGPRAGRADGPHRVPADRRPPYLLTLPSHGFLWFRLATERGVARLARRAHARSRSCRCWCCSTAGTACSATASCRGASRCRRRRERSSSATLLPTFVAPQRWYAAQGAPLQRVSAARLRRLDGRTARSWLLAHRTRRARGRASRRPISSRSTLAWEDTDEERQRALQPAAVAKRAAAGSVGIMADAMADERFCRAIVGAIGAGRELKSARTARCACSRTARFDGACRAPRSMPCRCASPVRAKQQHGRLRSATGSFLKAYRRLQAGINPEFEIGRFLTEVAHFAQLRAGRRRASSTLPDDGTRHDARAAAGLRRRTRATRWAYTLNYLEQFLEQLRAASAAAATRPRAARRLSRAGAHAGPAHGGAAHRACARAPAIRRSTPSRSSRATSRRGPPARARRPRARSTVWPRSMRADAATRRRRTPRRACSLRATRCCARIDAAAAAAPAGVKTRLHGDYHLGQVLLAQNDFVITDFEGEPARHARASGGRSIRR